MERAGHRRGIHLAFETVAAETLDLQRLGLSSSPKMFYYSHRVSGAQLVDSRVLR
jgi:hypothetical protein